MNTDKDMALILKVISFKNIPIKEGKQITIDRYGGTIGRSEDCALCLPDPEKFVSRLHATIKYTKGNYFLTDCSLGGTFIDKQKIPLINQSQQLFNNTILKIGEYQLSIVITEAKNKIENDNLPDLVAKVEEIGVISAQHTNNLTDQEDKDKTTVSFPGSQPMALVENSSKSDYFKEFLEGAELNMAEMQIDDPALTMQKVGQMFRSMVKGTVAVLRSRAEFKGFFHVTRTVLTSANHNPLKAVISTNVVLKQLLQDEIVEDLDSVDAIEQVFSDVVDHQLAMQAGIQAALRHLLETFDPDNIEQQYNKGVFLNKEARCWQSYKSEYPHLAKSALDTFFGDEFAEAYEKQMKILITMRNKK